MSEHKIRCCLDDGFCRSPLSALVCLDRRALVIEELHYGTFYGLSPIFHANVILTQIIYRRHRYETPSVTTVHC